jgi:small subunit ribosomal protein S6e
VVDGIFVGLPGYKLAITGGSDKDGFPMRRDLPGVKRRRILLTRGIGFQSMEQGLRMRMSIRGNAISPEVSQLNLKITQFGSKSLDELIKVEEKKK